MTKLILLILVSCVMCMVACEQERDPCLQPQNVYLRARSMKNVGDTTIADSLLPAPRWIAIDSGVVILFAPKTAAFNLPLNPHADSARFSLQPDSAVLSFDTVVFFYERQLHFLSNACGFTYYFFLQNVRFTQHHIDSVLLKNDEVNGNANTPEHVQVFL